MNKTRGKNRKSNKNADLNEPAKLTREPHGLAGEHTVLAEELAESTSERVDAKLAAQPS